MRTANGLAVLLGIAMTAVAARHPFAANAANVRAIRAARGSMERPPLDRFAVNCGLSGPASIPGAASKLLRGCAGAAADLQGILMTHPYDPVALALAGDAEWQARRPERARASWAAARDYRRLFSAGRYLERARSLDAAESMYSAAAGVPSSDGTADLALAALRWNRGNRNGAVQVYETSIARDARRGGDIAYSNLATLYAEQKRFREADAVLERGIALWPESASLRTTAGMTYAWSGRTELAAETLSRVLAENPGAADACYWLGWTRVRQGEDRAAVRQFSACLARHPNDVNARYELGVAEMRLGDLAAARAAFLSILAAAPDHRAASDRLREVEQALR